VLLASTAAFVDGNAVVPGNDVSITNSGVGSCPGARSDPFATPTPVPGSLANLSNADRGIYTASTLGICGISIKSGAFYIGFICAAAVIVVMRMVSVPANKDI
jgi:hypothetical protein